LDNGVVIITNTTHTLVSRDLISWQLANGLDPSCYYKESYSTGSEVFVYGRSNLYSAIYSTLDGVSWTLKYKQPQLSWGGLLNKGSYGLSLASISPATFQLKFITGSSTIMDNYAWNVHDDITKQNNGFASVITEYNQSSYLFTWGNEVYFTSDFDTATFQSNVADFVSKNIIIPKIVKLFKNDGKWVAMGPIYTSGKTNIRVGISTNELVSWNVFELLGVSCDLKSIIVLDKFIALICNDGIYISNNTLATGWTLALKESNFQPSYVVSNNIIIFLQLTGTVIYNMIDKTWKKCPVDKQYNNILTKIVYVDKTSDFYLLIKARGHILRSKNGCTNWVDESLTIYGYFDEIFSVGDKVLVMSTSSLVTLVSD